MDIVEIKNLIEGDVFFDENIKEEFSEDKSLFKIKPKVVIFPKDNKDIKTLIRWSKENNSSITFRSAGTDMTGGSITDEILVVFTKYFNHFEINPTEKTALIEPGVYFRDFEKKLENFNLMFPPYPASKKLCALGGMISNNSGGEKTLRYGKTEDYVLGLNVILSDGNEYYFEKLNKDKLQQKFSLQNFEGEIYRKIYKLINDNQELIKNSKIPVSKNSAGYNIWKIYDGENFDLTKLFVGSQGTLGVITKAKLKLVEKPRFSRLSVIFIYENKKIPELLHKILSLKPTSLEITDNHTFKIYLKFAQEMANLLGAKGIIGTFKLFLPEISLILKHGVPKLILLAEFEEDDINEIENKTKEIQKIAKSEKFPIISCKNETEVKKYWKLRRDTYKLLREKIKNRLAAPFIDDLIVNPDYFPEFLPRLTKILDEADIIYTISGHLGDGNLHIIPLMNMKKEKHKIIPLMDKVYDLVLEYNGSFTAEHNDGLIRGIYLEKLYGKEIYNLFVQIKKIFDPYEIFNKGKKINTDLEFVKKHMKT